MNFDQLVKEYFPDKLLNKSYGMVNESAIFANDGYGLESRGFLEPIKDEEHQVQKSIRPWFGKDGIKEHGIGYHPDYEHLSQTGEMENGYICTLFLDIAKSSRLNLIYDLQKASLIKNRILQVSIEVIRAFNGYPHRMMGDAIMAFFGDKSITEEQAAIDAVNCAAVLRNIIVDHVVKRIDEEFGEQRTKLGIRIGVDYGARNEVIWGAFGYTSAFEITAHGLSVDLCSKLQGMAGKNNIMLGEGIYSLIDFPESFLKVKEDSSGEVRYVTPNLTKADGESKINYGCRLVRLDEYYKLMPFKPENKGLTSNGFYDDFVYLCEYFDEMENKWIKYSSVSKPLGKEIALRFSLFVPNYYFENYIIGFKYKYTKVNHGKESREYKSNGRFDKSEGRLGMGSETHYMNGIPCKMARVVDSTRYRGIHQMNIEGLFLGMNNSSVFKDVVGVMIY